MSRFLNERLQCLEPYTPGEQPKKMKLIKLNTNENPYPPAPGVEKAVKEAAENLRLYPDPQSQAPTEALAQFFGVNSEQVFLCNGSDEVLAFCFQAFCDGGVAFADITYGFYPVYAGLYNIKETVVPLREDFSIDVKDYCGINKTVVLANPNAPTGLALSLDDVKEILQTNDKNLVIIDEAYVDFGAESCVSLLKKYDNLLVVGTFSKSRSMAGARVGYAVGSNELIADLNTVKYSFNPYNLNRMSAAAAKVAVEDKEYFDECRQKIIATREKVMKELVSMGFKGTESKTNFIFVEHVKYKGKEIYDSLREKNILVRRWDLPRIENYLRITIGTQEEMDVFLQAMREIVGK